MNNWIVASETASYIKVTDSHGKTIAQVPFSEDDLGIARLIAAAPDLLEACKDAIGCVDNLTVRTKLAAAIRKGS